MGYFDPVLSSMPEGWQSTLLSLPENVQKYFMENAQQMAADPMGTAKAVGTGFAKGATTDLAGLPVDTGVNLYNLGKAGAGYVGSKMGMPASSLPQMTEKGDVPGSSEWLAGKVREAGAGSLIDPPQGTSELANLFGSVVAPGPKGAKRSELFGGIKSVGANQETYKRARYLGSLTGEEKVSMDAIRDETGWFRDKKGDWQFEFSDKGSKYKVPEEFTKAQAAYKAKDEALRDAYWLKHIGMDPQFGYNKYATTQGERGFTPMGMIQARMGETGRPVSTDAITMAVQARDRHQIWEDLWQHGLNKPTMKGVEKQLPEIFEHPELFKRYPELADTKVKFKSMDRDTGGSFNHQTNTININHDMSDESIRSLLTHEVQHWIQKKEGFARGGAPIEFDPTSNRALKTLSPQIRDLRQQFSNEAGRLRMEAMNAADDETRMALYRKANKFDDKLANLEPERIYNRLLGEAQPRAAQMRMDMTMEERAKTRLKDLYPYGLTKTPLPWEQLLVRAQDK